MQSTQHQEPELEYHPEPSHSGATWLNGITWAIMAGCFLLALASSGYEALVPILILALVAGAGAAANLLMCLWCFATGRGRQTGPYLLGFLPLAAIAWWVLNEFSHIGKIGG